MHPPAPRGSGDPWRALKGCISHNIARTLALLILVGAQGWTGDRHRQSSKSTIPIDSGYVLALGVANRFLHAWQAGDLETGAVLLSDRARHAQNAETLEKFFSTGQERAFEITRGKFHAGRYHFPVILTTKQADSVRRVAGEIVVVSAGKNDYAVDKLP